MLPKIVAKLNKGSIKNVVPFGVASAAKPYVVVKPESRDGMRLFRIIAHMIPGQQSALEEYVFNEISELIVGWSSDDRFGNHFTIMDTGEWTDLVTTNDDSTISMERLLYVPFMTS